ncbi:TPA: hypothetical protein DCE37_11365 [Candidatus Latescibacteria bacterium]|nr:hypothetical protein [Candidatus Latescibacterota bacterium]
MKPLSIRSALAGAVLFALAVTACYETDPLPPAPSSDVHAPLPKQSRPAGSRGRAELAIREAVTQASGRSLGGGYTHDRDDDRSGGDLVIGVVVLLSLDDRALEPTIDDTQAFRPRPFEPGTFFSNATVFNNDLLDDEPGDPFANTLPFY